MKRTAKRHQAAETKKTAARKVVYHGAGGAILGNNPGITTKAQADRVINSLLGRPQPQQ